MRVSPTVTKLTCFSCGETFDVEDGRRTCRVCGMPLRVDLTLPVAAPADLIHVDDFSMWRYSGVLPIPRDQAVSLFEGFTPLVQLEERTWIKDESRNPTGSSTSRGMSMAVSAGVLAGGERLVAATNDSAAAALSAYGAAARLPVLVCMPDDTPEASVSECRHYGADVQLVPGSLSDAAEWLAGQTGPGDVDVSTMREPYRLEGAKTMAYEIFEQFHGDMPDLVVHPTGGGTGLIGMWKAWKEMERMGWVGEHRPRLVSVQSAGCAPIVRGFESGSDTTGPWDGGEAGRHDLRVSEPIAGPICLRAIDQTDGIAVAVPEQEMYETAERLAAATGVDVGAEGGAAWAATQRLRASGRIDGDDRVVVVNTRAGTKDG